MKAVLPEVAAACKDMVNSEQPAISSLDDRALNKYNETYGSIVADKTCKISDYPLTLRKLMDKYNKTLEEFAEVILYHCLLVTF